MLSRIENTTAVVRKRKSAYYLTLYEGTHLICSNYLIDIDNDTLENAILFSIEKFSNSITAPPQELARSLVSMNPVEIGDVLPQVTQVIDYGLPGGMDVYFGNDVFRLDGESYTNPHALEIWYSAVKHVPLNVDPKEYKMFVSNLQKMAMHSTDDPINTTIVDYLISALKGIQIHTEPDIDFYTEYSVSPMDLHAYLDRKAWVLYVTKAGISTLAEMHKLSTKKLREYLLPYLIPPGMDQKWIGDRKTPGACANIRMWMFDFRMLMKHDISLTPSMLNIEVVKQ